MLGKLLRGGPAVLRDGQGEKGGLVPLGFSDIRLGYAYQCVSTRRDGYFGVIFRCTELSHNHLGGAIYVPLSASFRDTLIVRFQFDEVVEIGPCSVNPSVEDIGAREIQLAG